MHSKAHHLCTAGQGSLAQKADGKCCCRGAGTSYARTQASPFVEMSRTEQHTGLDETVLCILHAK